MSICTHQPATSHHGLVSLSALSETLHLWRDRFQQRRELAHWSERDMHDAGVSTLDVMVEINKPFWRA
jgi:uncharacterized protein YjiS (DUF1127 family)